MTIIISVVSIVIVGIAVAPFMNRIIERQYVALNFYLNLPP